MHNSPDYRYKWWPCEFPGNRRRGRVGNDNDVSKHIKAFRADETMDRTREEESQDEQGIHELTCRAIRCAPVLPSWRGRSSLSDVERTIGALPSVLPVSAPDSPPLAPPMLAVPPARKLP